MNHFLILQDNNVFLIWLHPKGRWNKMYSYQSSSRENSGLDPFHVLSLVRYYVCMLCMYVEGDSWGKRKKRRLPDSEGCPHPLISRKIQHQYPLLDLEEVYSSRRLPVPWSTALGQ